MKKREEDDPCFPTKKKTRRPHSLNLGKGGEGGIPYILPPPLDIVRTGRNVDAFLSLLMFFSFESDEL